MPDEFRWNALVERLSGNLPPIGAFGRIVAAYSEPRRHYHTLDHVEQCLADFDAVRGLCEAPDEVEYAIWLHDVVYDPHASDNEEQSSHLAAEILLASGCLAAKARRIEELILITRHDRPPPTRDAQLIVDIDLAILGQPPAVFDIYEQNIRAEYSWLPAEAYRVGRAKILRGFLDRTPIYATARFEERYGRQARENLLRALDAFVRQE